ncbi:ubiquitin carboxyl-terminal hydrolase CYLD isoform X2 [Antennarius striatus]|uniref:ubiquitin carboxyl-terminal hydrolase CYLD isoform X2 n=1 Tax=Antennarius striatus TaxID=241820 RepID=UPI0035B1732F
MTSSHNVYFIVTRKPEGSAHIAAGHIGYASKYQYEQTAPSRPPRKVLLHLMGSASSIERIDRSHLEELEAEEAELLMALPDTAERLRYFREKEALRAAQGVAVGTDVVVMVDEGGEKLRGVVRSIGRRTAATYLSPLTGTFFEVELQGEDKGKSEASHRYESLASCPDGSRLFVPFSKLRLADPGGSDPEPQRPSPEPEELAPGDRVTYFVSDTYRHGMVVDVQERGGQTMVRISTDEDENGKTGGEVEVPLDCVAKGEVPPGPEGVDAPTEMKTDAPHADLTLNSLVEVTLASGNSFGIIRWIGTFPDRQEVLAGLELEEEVGVTDGCFRNQRLFSCPPRRGLLIRLNACRPDSRFQSPSANQTERKQEDAESKPDLSPTHLETVPPISSEQVNQILIGRMKGIQGHHNSCYMDAALFSLFSCSSVLDSMLFKSTRPRDAPIQETLLHDIVNPLRRRGFVEGRSVMKLRQQLQKHGYSHSFTTDEKDPEEFLSVIMHHILALDPLLKISAGGEVQQSYCYQIFLDQNHSLVLPTVQQLLEHSFHSAGLKLAEVPSCLILQMPRFGKKFKMFEKIIPSLELDVTDLLSEVPQQCVLCGRPAQEECAECFTDPLFSQTGFKVFCETCSSQVHSHPQRRSHQRAPLEVPEGYQGWGGPHTPTRDKLELFAVLCIETSHYVSFIKHGPDAHDWLFFDSMADRQGGSDGFNIPEVHACPEVGRYLGMSPAELASQVPRGMKGVAKRLFCDAYMYLYQSSSMNLYC